MMLANHALHFGRLKLLRWLFNVSIQRKSGAIRQDLRNFNDGCSLYIEVVDIVVIYDVGSRCLR